MAKFDSTMSTEIPGQVPVFSGVVTQKPSISGLFSTLTSAVDSWTASSAAQAKVTEQNRRDTAVGIYAQQQMELEDEQAELNQRLAEMRQQQVDLAQSTNPEDAAKLEFISRKYNQLQAAEAAGANPDSIKARQRALLKQQLNQNPHLYNEIVSSFKAVDAIQQADYEMSYDPYKSAIDEMLSKAAGGISVSAQVKYNQAYQKEQMAKLELDAKTREGKLKLQDELHYSVNASEALGVQVGQDVTDMLRAANEIDPQTGQPVGLDGNEAVAKMNMLIQANVTNYRMELMERNRNNPSITPDMLNQLTETYKGNVEASWKPFIEAADSVNASERIKKLLDNQIKISENNDLITMQKMYPAMSKARAFFGKDNMIDFGVKSSQIKRIISEKGTLSAKKHVDILGRKDPNWTMAWDMLHGEGFFSDVVNKIEEPYKSSGNPVYDEIVTSAGLEEDIGGVLSQNGSANILTSVLNGSSWNNQKRLLDDEYYNKVKSDPEKQKAINNVVEKEFSRLFGNFEKMNEIYTEGVSITFNPVDPVRVKSGSGYSPAKAFTVSSNASISVQKQVNKLNTVYTLLGGFMDKEELVKRASPWVKYLDSENPEFIKEHSTQKIADLLERREQTELMYDRRINKPRSPYGDPDMANYKVQQQQEKMQKLQLIDQEIWLEGTRNNPILQEGFTDEQNNMGDKDIPVLEEPMANYGVDLDFLVDVEGFEKVGYIPKKGGKVLGQSGVTIASGFDLGQWTKGQVVDMGMPENLVAKFEPYFGKKKGAAEKALEETPLILTQKEAMKANEVVKSYYLKDVDKLLQKEAGYSLADIPPTIQTAITSVLFQYGTSNPAKRMPKFWTAVKNKDWPSMYEELRNFGDKYGTRRNKEADLIEAEAMQLKSRRLADGVYDEDGELVEYKDGKRV